MTDDDPHMPFSDNPRLATIEAIRRIRHNIQWRPGKDIQHLAKRIRLRHLEAGTTIAQYEALITAIIHDNQAKVYLFQYNEEFYPTIVSSIRGTIWLVMIGLDGVMETAFPPSDPDAYLSDLAFQYVSVIEELLQ